MSVIPVVSSAADLPAAIKVGNNRPSCRWYVAKRAEALGAANMVPAHWGLTASAPPPAGRKRPESRRALTAAGWDSDLHPRDRKGRFIEVNDLINVFSAEGGTQISFRGVAVGNGKTSDGREYIEVHPVGPDGEKAGSTAHQVPVENIESAPPAKAKLTPDGAEAPGDGSSEDEIIKVTSETIQVGDVIHAALANEPRWEVTGISAPKGANEGGATHGGGRNIETKNLKTGKDSPMTLAEGQSYTVTRKASAAESEDDDDTPLSEPIESEEETVGDDFDPDDSIEPDNEEDFVDKVSTMLAESGYQGVDEARVREMWGELTVDDAIDQYIEEQGEPVDENAGVSDVYDFGTVEEQNFNPAEDLPVAEEDVVIADEAGAGLSPEALDQVRPLRDLLDVDSGLGSWASGLSNHQFESLGNYVEDWMDDPETVPPWAADALDGAQGASEALGITDVYDTIQIRKESAELGWSVEEQMRGILDGDNIDEFNPTAIENVARFLKSVNHTDTDAPTIGRALLKHLHSKKTPEPSAPNAPGEDDDELVTVQEEYTSDSGVEVTEPGSTAPDAPEEPTEPVASEHTGANGDAVLQMAKSAGKESVAISPEEATKRIDEILATHDQSGDNDAAHKSLAALMTELKLGGKQRKRYREALDRYIGVEGDDSAKSEAATVAENLSDSNPVKDKLAAKAARGGTGDKTFTDVGAPKTGGKFAPPGSHSKQPPPADKAPEPGGKFAPPDSHTAPAPTPERDLDAMANQLFDFKMGQKKGTGKLPEGVKKVKVDVPNLSAKSNKYRTNAKSASEIQVDGKPIGTVMPGKVGGSVKSGSGNYTVGWAAESSGWLAFDEKGNEVRGVGLTATNAQEAIALLLQNAGINSKPISDLTDAELLRALRRSDAGSSRYKELQAERQRRKDASAPAPAPAPAPKQAQGKA